MNKLTCLFGFHKWKYHIIDYVAYYDMWRYCDICDKHEYAWISWETRSEIEEALKAPEKYFKW